MGSLDESQEERGVAGGRGEWEMERDCGRRKKEITAFWSP